MAPKKTSPTKSAVGRKSAAKKPLRKKTSPRRKSTSASSARGRSARGRSGSPTPQPTTASAGRLYADPSFIPLTGTLPNGEANEYDAYASILQPIPPPRAGASLIVNLADVLGKDAVDAITAAGKIVFHSVGDTGADKQNRVVDEADVAGAMTRDLATDIPGERPAFFYHLGDVVY